MDAEIELVKKCLTSLTQMAVFVSCETPSARIVVKSAVRLYMLIVKSQPWSKIAEHYRSMSEKNPAFQSTENLVEQIAASKYSTGLFAATSMHTLLIAQTTEFDWDKEILRVSLDIWKGDLVFDFQETNSNHPKYQHWIRRCSPEDGFTRLERFLALKKWFVEYKA